MYIIIQFNIVRSHALNTYHISQIDIEFDNDPWILATSKLRWLYILFGYKPESLYCVYYVSILSLCIKYIFTL